jgi:uncharacterized repeat protein (TIGR03806 family)
MRTLGLFAASMAAATAACVAGGASSGTAAGSAADTATMTGCIATTPDAVPDKLSATGCFDPGTPGKATDKLVPYDVNSPLWSDGAQKSRWMSVPTNAKIHVNGEGHFNLPVGSVLVKEFRIGDKRIETRLFMHHTDGSWAGYSYEWSDDGTEATLLPDDGKTKKVGGQSWTFPSRDECMMCHNESAGFSLGLETGQLNRSFGYVEGASNELDKIAALGLLDNAPGPNRAKLPAPADDTSTLEDRARSYLHANCAFCHRPGGPGIGAADFRFGRPFKGAHVCNMEPRAGDLGVAGAMLLVPGKPEQSLISLRMHRTSEGERMPPLASAIVDQSGGDVVDVWIRSVTACP